MLTSVINFKTKPKKSIGKLVFCYFNVTLRFKITMFKVFILKTLIFFFVLFNKLELKELRGKM